jgi:hypothetical protein
VTVERDELELRETPVCRSCRKGEHVFCFGCGCDCCNDDDDELAVELRYHVPRSQVWEGSRGRQRGAVHLHVGADVQLTARLYRAAGTALCGRRGWYERPADAGELERVELRCSSCSATAERFGIGWPS